MSHHRVKLFTWLEELQIEEFILGSFREAIEFARGARADKVKVYGPNGNVVHEITNKEAPDQNYA
jgi:hypothetical protein